MLALSHVFRCTEARLAVRSWLGCCDQGTIAVGAIAPPWVHGELGISTGPPHPLADGVWRHCGALPSGRDHYGLHLKETFGRPQGRKVL